MLRCFSCGETKVTLRSFLLLSMCPEQHPKTETEIPKGPRNLALHPTLPLFNVKRPYPALLEAIVEILFQRILRKDENEFFFLNLFSIKKHSIS